MVITPPKFISMMCSDPAAPTSKCPVDHVSPVQGIVPEGGLARPQIHDADGEPCILLIKNGCTMNTIIGHGTGIKSFVRDCFPGGTEKTLMQLAIVGYDNRSGALSNPGDSGAIIVGGQGRVAAFLTGGSG